MTQELDDDDDARTIAMICINNSWIKEPRSE